MNKIRKQVRTVDAGTQMHKPETSGHLKLASATPLPGPGAIQQTARPVSVPLQPRTVSFAGQVVIACLVGSALGALIFARL